MADRRGGRGEGSCRSLVFVDCGDSTVIRSCLTWVMETNRFQQGINQSWSLQMICDYHSDPVHWFPMSPETIDRVRARAQGAGCACSRPPRAGLALSLAARVLGDWRCATAASSPSCIYLREAGPHTQLHAGPGSAFDPRTSSRCWMGWRQPGCSSAARSRPTAAASRRSWRRAGRKRCFSLAERAALESEMEMLEPLSAVRSATSSMACSPGSRHHSCGEPGQLAGAERRRADSAGARSSTARRLLSLFRPVPRAARRGPGLIVLSAGLGMVSPFLLRAVLDDAIPNHDTSLLAALVAGMIGVAIATGALGVAQTLLSNQVGQRVMHDLRSRRLPPPAAALAGLLHPHPHRRDPVAHRQRHRRRPERRHLHRDLDRLQRDHGHRRDDRDVPARLAPRASSRSALLPFFVWLTRRVGRGAAPHHRRAPGPASPTCRR